MSTNPIYAFEHADSGTLLRAHHDSQRLELLRRDVDGRYQPLAAIGSHPNHQVCHVDGRVLYHHGHGAKVFELGAEDPEASAFEVSRKISFLIDREHGLVNAQPKYPYAAPEGTEHVGLILVRLGDGSVAKTWDSLDGEVRQVSLFPSRREHVHYNEFAEDNFELVRGSGGRWALVASRRVAIGEGTDVHARVEWSDEQMYPQKGAFDEARERLLITGRPGIAALDFDGSMVASWTGELPNAPTDYRGRALASEIISPPLVEGDEVLVVVKEPTASHDDGPRWTRVVRLNASDLSLVGDHPIGRLKEPGDQAALLRLADGSLAWFPRSVPLRILPAEGVTLQTSDVAHVVGDEPPALFAEPDTDWYEPALGRDGDLESRDVPQANEGQRRSLARFLLERRARDPRWRELLLTDPRAFAPFADQLVALDDTPLSALRDAEWQMGAQAAWGAGDAAVDELAGRIRDGLGDGRHLPQLTTHRVKLLANVHTAHALAVAAELGREDARVQRALRGELVEVPLEGLARVRYEIDARELYALRESRVDDETPSASPGLSCGATFGRGKRCALPLLEVLRLDDSALPGGWVFFASQCEGCDEAIEERYDFDAAMKIDGLEEPECQGEGESSEERVRAWTGPYEQPKSFASHAGRLGGRPMWWQSPEPADCKKCERLMFYVGCVFAASIRDDVADLALYAFRCDDCGTRAQVMQMT